MATWTCQTCNYSNNFKRQSCKICGKKIRGQFKIEEVSYYYKNTSVPVQGPITVNELGLLYVTEQVNDFTYLWNGTTIKKWTILHKTSLMKPNAKTKLNRVIICESIDNPKASRRRKLFQNKSASSPKTKSKQIKKNGLFRFFSSKKGFGGKYDQVLLLQN
eukprot:193796_1